MKEQLISFETAKLAKEKGFANNIDEQVKGFYIDGKFKKGWSYNSDETEITSNRISAPTQSLLQKWLREVHKIELWMGRDSVYSEYKCEGDLNENRGVIATYFHNTYEDALEKGLQEALKLIN